MEQKAGSALLENLWDEAHASTLREPELLLYRSYLLGSDHRITNYGGGNTSAKLSQFDPITGEAAEVLWVKGSGGDLGSMGVDGFATLYMDKLQQLRGLYRGKTHEDEMVAYFPHTTFNLNPRAPSIDTPLHAYVPYKHIDHMHPDAVIAIACSADSENLTQQVFGGRLGWLPWQRPGYDLGLRLEALVRERPDIQGAMLQGHGLITWADEAKACYETTLEVINTAIRWLAEQDGQPAFGGERVAGLAPERRRAAAARLMPEIRRRIAVDEAKIGHFDDQEAVLEFVNSRELVPLAALGTSCPDHFLRTKIRPLVIDFDPAADETEHAVDGLDDALGQYRRDYRAYYERHATPDSPPLRDPNPVVYLVPGVGMITFAKDKKTACVAAEFYVNAINVMREASRVDRYVGLDEAEAFDIEYWQLEEAKLRRLPPPKSLAGKVALVTGGAGGIGQAIAERLMGEGACVVLADRDEPGGVAARDRLAQAYEADRVASVCVDVTDEARVDEAVDATVLAYGGLDLLISNAGIATASPIAETSLALWEKTQSVLTTGYFLVSRAAFRLMMRQGLGGAVVFIGSKNGLVASPGAAAYCAAKASELHLARCLALEGAQHGIRVNVVNPDAVLRGSKIWDSDWRQARAATYGVDQAELESYYRDRSLLKREVLPLDVAEAVYFFVSEHSSKSTGNVLNVDAGNSAAFSR